jgi:hypothetical protein
MEGGPKNPSQKDETQLFDQALLHISALPLGVKEQALVSTLITTQRLGTLVLTLNKNQVKVLDILPNQSREEKAIKISEAFNDLYTVWEELKATNPAEPEHYDVAFNDANMH